MSCRICVSECLPGDSRLAVALGVLCMAGWALAKVMGRTSTVGTGLILGFRRPLEN